MSSSKKCAEPGCTFYASADSDYCSAHKPKSEEEMAQVAQKASEEAELAAAKEAELKEAARNFSSRVRPVGNEGDRKYLVIGASPDEDRRGRTHYSNKQVYLLGNEKPQRTRGVNYSRYIVADYSSRNAKQLRKVAEQNAARFDEMIFDYSTMCEIRNRDETLVHRLESFYIMLKPNGVLYLPDCGLGNRDIEVALSNLGFYTTYIKMRDLEPTEIPHMLKLAPDSIILVAIKRAGMGAPNRRGGSSRSRSRKLRSRSRKLSSRRLTKTARR